MPSKPSKLFFGFAVAGVAIAVLLFAFYRFGGTRRDLEELGTSSSTHRFELSTRAASFLENIQYDQAERLYQELRQLAPKESAYVRNAAIAALANVKYHMDLAQDPKNDIDRIRSELPNLFERAARAIQEYRDLRPDDPIAFQLDALRDARWISLLAAANPIIADEEQAKLLEKLRTYAERFPTNAFLVTQFNNSADVMSAVDPTILDQTIEPLRKVHAANPRNIYLLCLLIQRLVQARDPSVLELVEPLATLLEPFEWKWKMERRPKDLSDLRRAVDLGATDLDAALGILIGWVGEAKFTEGSLVDARSIEISELAFLDLSDLARMLQDRKGDATRVPPPDFQTHPLDLQDCLGLKWLDWNVDTRAELLVWTKDQLMLGELSDAMQWNELGRLALPSPIQGVVAVDLFAVDAHRGTSARTTIDPNNREAQLTASMRHETIRDLLLYGDAGVSVVAFQPPFESQPHWSVLEEDCGLSDLQGVTAIAPVDWESDGDLDLVLVSQGRLYLRENMGNRQFRDVNPVSLLPDASLKITSIAIVDYDRDVDLDILVSHASGFGVMENIQHGQFRYRELGDAWKPLAASKSLAFGDFDNNYSWDFVGSHFQGADRTGISLLSTSTQLGQGVSASLSQSLEGPSGMVAVADWNNDAKLDVVVRSEDGVTLWMNRGGNQFDPISLLASASPNPQINASVQGTLSIGDAQADGWLEIAAIVDGRPTLLSPTPQPDKNFLVYRVKGISDANGGGRNNQYAVGSTVEIFGPFGYQVRVIEEDAVHFGLGPDAAYSLRLIFVNGLTQGVIDPKNNAILEEKQVLIGSCPFVYGWDGEGWQMITDLLWNAPLGLQVAKGKVLPDRRWEYLLLPGDTMQPHENAYELRVTEELWESAYFDHVALMSVDHPAEVEILSNEKVGPPSIAEPKLWAFRETYAPRSVTDSHGRDWLESIRENDGVYAIPFQKQFKQGLVQPSYLEIDFENIDSSRPAQLILTGWIYPTDTSLNIGIDQNPMLEPPSPPQLWTVGASGAFEIADPFIGFPGGKPKTIVVPLDHPFATDDHRIRIVHSSQIFWDQIRLGYGTPIPIDTTQRQALVSPPHDVVRAHWLPMSTAELRQRGFSREMPRRWFEPHWYDYARVSLEPAWPPLGGKFTRLGDVRELIQADDDALVVMGAGDEMRLRFDVPESRPPEGWVRDFVLHSVGWDKDAALNTLEGQSSLPLPFSGMSQYPPGQEDREEAKRVDRLHRATLTRRQSPERFWKPTRQPGAGPLDAGRDSNGR